VTVAVNALARAGTLTRTPDGAWLLPLDAAEEVDELPSRVVEHRRDLLVGERVRRSAAG
jgi:hypothetical protein